MLVGTLGVIVLSFALYFYIALEGNPINKYQERRKIIDIYEKAYETEFKVQGANYDYKRGEFQFVLYPMDDPQMSFETNLAETRYKDAYGEVRGRTLIRRKALDSLRNDFDYLGYNLNVFEDYYGDDIFEPDLTKRLDRSNYVIDFTYDVDVIEANNIDEIMIKIIEKLKSSWDVEVSKVKVRVGVYDGSNYYFKEWDLEDNY